MRHGDLGTIVPKTIEPMTVSYRHISVPNGSEPTVSGFALWYGRPTHAESFASALAAYYEIKSEKRISINFKRDSGSRYSVKITIPSTFQTWSTSINEIPESSFEALSNSLSTYGHIFIVAGYTDEAGDEHVVPGTIYVASVLCLEGVNLKRGSLHHFPWDRIRQIFS